jgi:hypothetical protein
MRSFRHVICFALVLLSGLVACSHDPSIINRRYVLDPTMDPAKTQPLGQANVIEAASSYDVSAQAGQAALTGACPTCGG